MLSTKSVERKSTCVFVNLMLIVLVLASTASAQQKVGTMPDPVTDYTFAFYSLNFLDGAAAARGGSGIALSLGARSSLANPAGLFGGDRLQVHLEGAGLRNELDPAPLGFPATPYRQPNPRANAAASVRLGDRIALAAGFSNPRDFESNIRWEFEEVTYEYPDGTGRLFVYTLDRRLRVLQYSLALAVKAIDNFSAGFAVDYQHFTLGFDEASTDSSFPFHNSAHDTHDAVLLRFGILQEINNITLGLAVRSGGRFTFDVNDQSSNWGESSQIPWEFSFGASYRDLLTCEGKWYRFRDNYYPTDLYDLGAGAHIPLLVSGDAAALHLNLGLIYRHLLEIYGRRDAQVFVNSGLEAKLRDFQFAATVINGHWLSDKEVRVSEVQLSLGYSVP
jgi:hypothetical protein